MRVYKTTSFIYKYVLKYVTKSLMSRQQVVASSDKSPVGCSRNKFANPQVYCNQAAYYASMYSALYPYLYRNIGVPLTYTDRSVYFGDHYSSDEESLSEEDKNFLKNVSEYARDSDELMMIRLDGYLKMITKQAIEVSNDLSMKFEFSPLHIPYLKNDKGEKVKNLRLYLTRIYFYWNKSSFPSINVILRYIDNLNFMWYMKNRVVYLYYQMVLRLKKNGIEGTLNQVVSDPSDLIGYIMSCDQAIHGLTIPNVSEMEFSDEKIILTQYVRFTENITNFKKLPSPTAFINFVKECIPIYSQKDVWDMYTAWVSASSREDLISKSDELIIKLSKIFPMFDHLKEIERKYGLLVDEPKLNELMSTIKEKLGITFLDDYSLDLDSFRSWDPVVDLYRTKKFPSLECIMNYVYGKISFETYMEIDMVDLYFSALDALENVSRTEGWESHDWVNMSSELYKRIKTLKWMIQEYSDISIQVSQQKSIDSFWWVPVFTKFDEDNDKIIEDIKTISEKLRESNDIELTLKNTVSDADYVVSDFGWVVMTRDLKDSLLFPSVSAILKHMEIKRFPLFMVNNVLIKYRNILSILNKNKENYTEEDDTEEEDEEEEYYDDEVVFLDQKQPNEEEKAHNKYLKKLTTACDLLSYELFIYSESISKLHFYGPTGNFFLRNNTEISQDPRYNKGVNKEDISRLIENLSGIIHFTNDPIRHMQCKQIISDLYNFQTFPSLSAMEKSMDALKFPWFMKTDVLIGYEDVLSLIKNQNKKIQELNNSERGLVLRQCKVFFGDFRNYWIFSQMSFNLDNSTRFYDEGENGTTDTYLEPNFIWDRLVKKHEIPSPFQFNVFLDKCIRHEKQRTVCKMYYRFFIALTSDNITYHSLAKDELMKAISTSLKQDTAGS